MQKSEFKVRVNRFKFISVIAWAKKAYFDLLEYKTNIKRKEALKNYRRLIFWTKQTLKLAIKKEYHTGNLI
jgi:hypothetical protein